VGALLLAGTVTLAAPAWATVESDLAAAENAYAALDYQTAMTMADQILARRGLSHDVLTRTIRVGALSHAAMGDGEVAKKLFVRLIQADPDFKVDSKLGPRFTGPFAEARGYWQAEGRKPGMASQVLLQWKQGGQIRVTTTDPLNIVKRVSIGFRWAPAHEYTVSTVDPAAVREAEVPANPEGASRLEYYVQEVDANDDVIFEEGTPELPKNMSVTEPPKVEEKKSILASPIFYIVGGAVIAGAAVGGYFLFRPTEYTAATTGMTTLTAFCGSSACK
jgi:hypothetical protein